MKHVICEGAAIAISVWLFVAGGVGFWRLVQMSCFRSRRAATHKRLRELTEVRK